MVQIQDKEEMQLCEYCKRNCRGPSSPMPAMPSEVHHKFPVLLKRLKDRQNTIK
jgi:hypothetical protein